MAPDRFHAGRAARQERELIGRAVRLVLDTHRRWLGTALAGLLMAWAPAGCAQPAAPLLGPVSLAYFGLVMNREGAKGQLPWPSVRFGSWRMWDSYVNWPNLERERSRWDFSVLDKMVDEAQAHGVEVLMPLAHSPRWASARPDEPGPEAAAVSPDALPR